MITRAQQRLRDGARLLARFERAGAPEIARAAAIVSAALREGSKIMLCGNGGSAADASHIAADLVNRFERERRPLPAMALTVDPSVLTSIANDFGFEHVFSRQVRAYGRPGDVLIAITTSGRSPNVLDAVR